MELFLVFLEQAWRYRRTWMWPLVMAPVVWLGISLSHVNLYTATAVLQVDVAKLSSPLLQAMARPGQKEVLSGILHAPNLLADTTKDTGINLNPQHIHLDIPNDQLLKVSYSANRPEGLENVTDSLAYNFIYEILSPERLRLEQRLASLGTQMQEIQKLLTATIEEAGRMPLLSRQTQLQQAYQKTLDDLSSINAAFEKGTPQAVIWFAEPARVQPRPSLWLLHGKALVEGILVGVLLAFAAVFIRKAGEKGVRNLQALNRITGLPTLAEIPNLGRMMIFPGYAEVNTGAITLNPCDFAEVARLHRLLTRGLKGSLSLISAEGGEGTSLLAFLMALKSAQSGKKALLVDLNLRNPSLTMAQDLSGAPWKLAGRRSRDSLKDIIVPLGESGLDMLPVPNDTETLEWLNQPGLAQDLFESLKEKYDHIWVDTSPVTVLNRQNADPLMLAAATDRTVIVVKMASTPEAKVHQTAEDVMTSGAHVAGVLANNVVNPSRAQTLKELAQAMRPWLPTLSQKLLSLIN